MTPLVFESALPFAPSSGCETSPREAPSRHPDLIGVLDRFCSAFADRDADGVMRLFAPDRYCRFREKSLQEWL